MDEDKTVRVMKALGDPHRFRMLKEIASAGELSCGEIGKSLPLAQPTVSHHLKILVDAGLIKVRKQAQHHYLSVDGALLTQCLGMVRSRLSLEGSGRKSRNPSLPRKGAWRGK